MAAFTLFLWEGAFTQRIYVPSNALKLASYS